MGKNGDPGKNKGNSGEKPRVWDVLMGRGKNAGIPDSGIDGLQDSFDHLDDEGVENGSDPEQAQGGDPSLAHLVEETGEGVGKSNDPDSEKDAEKEPYDDAIKTVIDRAREAKVIASSELGDTFSDVEEQQKALDKAWAATAEAVDEAYEAYLGSPNAMETTDDVEIFAGPNPSEEEMKSEALRHAWGYENMRHVFPTFNDDSRIDKGLKRAFANRRLAELEAKQIRDRFGADALLDIEDKLNKSLGSNKATESSKRIDDSDNTIAPTSPAEAHPEASPDAIQAMGDDDNSDNERPPSTSASAGVTKPDTKQKRDPIGSRVINQAVAKAEVNVAIDPSIYPEKTPEAPAQEPAESKNGEGESSEEKIDADKAIADYLEAEDEYFNAEKALNEHPEGTDGYAGAQKRYEEATGKKSAALNRVDEAVNGSDDDMDAISGRTLNDLVLSKVAGEKFDPANEDDRKAVKALTKKSAKEKAQQYNDAAQALLAKGGTDEEVRKYTRQAVENLQQARAFDAAANDEEGLDNFVNNDFDPNATPISEVQPANSKDENNKPDANEDEKSKPEQNSADWMQGELELDKRPFVGTADVAKAYENYAKLHGDERKAQADKLRKTIDNGYDDRMEKKYSREGDKNADGEVRGELKAGENLPIPFGHGMDLKVTAENATIEQIDEAIAAWDSELRRDSDTARDTDNDAKRFHQIEKMYSAREKLEALRNLAAEKALKEATVHFDNVYGADQIGETNDENTNEILKGVVEDSQKKAANRLLESEGFKMASGKTADGREVEFPDMSDSENLAKLNKIIRRGGSEKDLADLSIDEIADLIAGSKADADGVEFAEDDDDATKLKKMKAIAEALSLKELLICYGNTWRKDELEAREKAKQEAEQAKQSEEEPTPEEAAEAAADAANKVAGDGTEPGNQLDHPENSGDAPTEEEKPTEPEKKKIYSDDEIDALEKYAQATADAAAEKLAKGSGYFGGHDRGEDFGKLQADALAAFSELAEARGSRLDQDNPNATPEELAAKRSELSQADVWARNQVYGIFEQHMDGDKGPEKLNRLTKVWRKIGKMNSNINGTIDDHIHNKWGRIAARGIVYGVAGVAATTAVGMLGLTGVGGAVAGTGTAAALAAVRLKQGARGTVYTKDKDGNKVWRNLTPEAVERMAKEKRLKFAISVGAAALGAFAKLGISEFLNHHAGAMAGGSHNQSLSDLDQNTSGSRSLLHVDGGNVPNPGADVSNLINIPGAGNLSPQDATNLVLRTVQGQYGDGEARKQALGASYDWVQGMVDKIAAAHGGNVLNVQPQDITPESLGLGSAA